MRPAKALLRLRSLINALFSIYKTYKENMKHLLGSRAEQTGLCCSCNHENRFSHGGAHNIIIRGKK